MLSLRLRVSLLFVYKDKNETRLVGQVKRELSLTHLSFFVSKNPASELNWLLRKCSDSLYSSHSEIVKLMISLWKGTGSLIFF